MPVVYRCSACGFILYIFVRKGQDTRGIPTPSSIIYMYGGRCPRCGKPLRPPSHRDIEIRIATKELLRELIRLAEEQHVYIPPDAYIMAGLWKRTEAEA